MYNFIETNKRFQRWYDKHYGWLVAATIVSFVTTVGLIVLVVAR